VGIHQNILLRLGQIFCSISAFRKFRNTKSIPKFTKLELKQNLLPKPSKIYFLGYLRLAIASPNIITQVFPKVKQNFHLFQTFLRKKSGGHGTILNNS
jgi:hypothetical protein